MLERIGLGVSIFITTKCNHQCGHCIMSCGPDSGSEMSMQLFEEIVYKCKGVGLLNSVVLAGGEPFLDPSGLLEKIHFLLRGHGVLRILVPTNGRWILNDDYEEIADRLSALGRLVPFGLSVRLSENKWNFEQFRERKEDLLSRWELAEKRNPSVFCRKVLLEEKVIRMGRGIALPGETSVPVHCSFDEWRDGTLGIYTDYLSFWPDGSCRVCQSGGGVLGTYLDDYRELLEKRVRFLTFLRDTNKNGGPGVHVSVCRHCMNIMNEWSDDNK